MRVGTRFEKFASAVLMLSIGVVVSGTKACQTDYEVGVQSSVPTGETTNTPTGEETGSPTTTPTGSVTASVTAESSESVTPEATEAPDPTLTAEAASGADDLFNELSKLGVDSGAGGRAEAPAVAAGGGVVQPENWLGDAFSKDEDDVWKDTDGDGFHDTLEEEIGTDPTNSASAPYDIMVTRLSNRVSLDGLRGGAIRESGDVADSDGDGVSDQTEEKRGINPQVPDTDGDGLPDNKELAVGTNPLQIDSDRDGISDGREFDSGSDPTVPEPKRGGE